MSLSEEERAHSASPCNLQQKLNSVLETSSYFGLNNLSLLYMCRPLTHTTHSNLGTWRSLELFYFDLFSRKRHALEKIQSGQHTCLSSPLGIWFLMMIILLSANIQIVLLKLCWFYMISALIQIINSISCCLLFLVSILLKHIDSFYALASTSLHMCLPVPLH